MKPIDLRIAEELGVREQQVAAAISLLDGGATVPFVARYRKRGLTAPETRRPMQSSMKRKHGSTELYRGWEPQGTLVFLL
jgi:transcriptional accessory protein Tex/SPT6